jgi:hypothetical protein
VTEIEIYTPLYMFFFSDPPIVMQLAVTFIVSCRVVF